MAMADSVFEVSGATIAFILGFYEELIDALNNLVSDLKNRYFDLLKNLFKLGIGWISGFFMSVLFITCVFEKIYMI